MLVPAARRALAAVHSYQELPALSLQFHLSTSTQCLMVPASSETVQNLTPFNHFLQNPSQKSVNCLQCVHCYKHISENNSRCSVLPLNPVGSPVPAAGSFVHYVMCQSSNSIKTKQKIQHCNKILSKTYLFDTKMLRNDSRKMFHLSLLQWRHCVSPRSELSRKSVSIMPSDDKDRARGRPKAAVR